MSQTTESILIIDFGSQYTQLIARRIRELGVFSIIKQNNISLNSLKEINPKGIILSGGPESVHKSTKLTVPKYIFDYDVPILGICYGMQLLADHFGGKISQSSKKEFGPSSFTRKKNSKLFIGKDIPKKFNVWMSHSDKVIRLPSDFILTGSSDNSDISAFQCEKRNVYGLQFHPEVTHTSHGKKILDNFCRKVCACRKSWTTKNKIQEIISDIKNKVGNEKVLLALSGGVDSSVVAALIKRAIGKNLHCMFINTGLHRKNEVRDVKENIQKSLKVNLQVINAETQFLRNLKGVTDPEKKRKIIGETFIRIFEKESKKLKKIHFLAQGTIYPDVIESSSKKSKSDVIKSHHNVGGLPKKFNFFLIEPIRKLFKDEVRKIGKELSIPNNLIGRHPFPGPGLAVRIVGEVTKERISILREVDHIFIDEIKNAGLYHKISQALAVFLPIKSVGVMGDQRKYNYVVAIRAVTTTDFMTAKISVIPYDVLNMISTRVVNEVPKVARVVYDITNKPPGTIEWE